MGRKVMYFWGRKSSLWQCGILRGKEDKCVGEIRLDVLSSYCYGRCCLFACLFMYLFMCCLSIFICVGYSFIYVFIFLFIYSFIHLIRKEKDFLS